MESELADHKKVMENIHDCNQGDKFNKIQQKIAEVKADLDEHRASQQLQDKEREIRLAERAAKDQELNDKLTEISKQITSLLELNTEYTDFKTAWKVGKNMGFTLAMFITTMGVIFGGLYAVKSWINK